MGPFQIIFNQVSSAELAGLPKDIQLKILGNFKGLPEEAMKTDLTQYGQLHREGHTLYRFRWEEYRIYFERHPLGIQVVRILNRNTVKDFLYRSNLPVPEDRQLESNPEFWKLMDETAR
jgi:mRNA-degrading endonuclease RelE of RelBE toxin-antitoxin system